MNPGHTNFTAIVEVIYAINKNIHSHRISDNAKLIKGRGNRWFGATATSYTTGVHLGRRYS